MKSILCISGLVFLFSVTGKAQPAFTTVGEVAVGASTSLAPPSVAVRQDGAAWVAWGDAAQWFTADGAFDGGNKRDGKYLRALLGLADGRWAGIVSKDTTETGWSAGTTTRHMFLALPRTGKADSSAGIFTTGNWYIIGENEGGTSFPYATSSESSGDISWCAYNIIGNSMMHYFTEIKAYRGAVKYDFGKRKMTHVLPEKQAPWNLDAEYPQELRLAKDYGVPFSTLSPARDERILLFTRGQHFRYFPSNPKMHFLSCALFSLQGDTLSGEVVLDSIEARYTDLSDRVVLGNNADLFHLHVVLPGDSLVADRYTLGGKFLSRSFVLPSVRLFAVIQNVDTIRQTKGADFKIRSLSADRFLMMWSQNDPGLGNQVYTGIVNSDMAWTTPPKRVNGVLAGNHYAPDFTVKRDTVFAVWLDTRNGPAQVYMRRFTVNQITGVEAPGAVKDFMMLDVSPNPVRSTATVRYQVPGQSLQPEAGNPNRGPAISLRVYDMLGRVVQTLVDGNRGAGIHTASLDASDLPNGFYQIALQTGNRYERRNIVVRK